MHELPIAWIRHAAQHLGADSPVFRGALAAAGLSPAVLADEATLVSTRKCVEFLEQAARLSGDDALGLKLGKSYDPRASGLSAYVSISAETLREGFLNAIRYGALSDTSADYTLEDRGNVATVRIDSRSAYFRSHRQGSEFKMAFVVASCRNWASERFRLLEVRFAHPRTSSIDAFTKYFRCPVLFQNEATELLFDPAMLSLPMRSADPHLLALLKRLGDELMAARSSSKTPLRSRVERLILNTLPEGVPEAARVSRALGLSERTLARQLSAEGTSYQQVVNDLRRDTAKSYLSDPGFSIGQVAYLLGYSEQSAFTTAFRRWTGESPRTYRSAIKSAPSAGNSTHP
jgi:AraC-like DNA-binding protein